MDRFARIHKLHAILNQRRYPISRRELEEKLECSKATVERTIEDLRDYVGAPVKYDRQRNGYIYDGESHTFHLPGLWFNASELHALLATQQLLANVQPGLLEEHLDPLRQRIDELLQHEQMGDANIARRIRILTMARRPVNTEAFQRIATGLTQRQQITFDYHSRGRGQTTHRSVSPQRLIYYRDNWYLDAWCHLRDALRSFALDAIEHVRTTKIPAREIDTETLDHHFTRSYGIFAGQPRHTAILRFSVKQARWVSHEQWHPQQQGQWLDDGRYQLTIPYSDPTELIMDILKHGAEVEVIGPKALRTAVRQALNDALKQYQSNHSLTE